MPNIPQPILEAIKNDRLIIWVGAGFSQGRLGLPSWTGLVKELASACLSADEAAALSEQLDKKALSEVEALESLYPQAEKCHGILQKRFDMHINREDSRLDDFHLLWQITHKIITTNYDTGLDISMPGEVARVLYYQKYQYRHLLEGEGFYFKVHGCASEPQHCILFEQQYRDLYRDTNKERTSALSDEDTPAKFLLKQLLAGHTILFVGFGIEDRIDYVLQYIHQLFDGIESPKYSILLKKDEVTWPHTSRWEIEDWSEIPSILSALAAERAAWLPVSEPVEDIRPTFERKYVGRDDAVEKLLTFFRSDRRFMFLYGPGGMGKSHLLDAVMKQLDAESRPLYFKITSATRLRDLARAIGLPVLPPVFNNNPHPYFLNAVKKLNRVVVIDDFYECNEEILKNTLMALPHQEGVRSILISRSLPLEFSELDSGIKPLGITELGRDSFRLCLQDINEESEFFEAGIPDAIEEKCWELTQGYPLGGQLLLGLMAEPDFAPENLQKLQLEHDPDRKKFIGRLLGVILKEGREAERDLAHQIAVFDEAVPEEAFVELPAWKDNWMAFHALWKRKRVLFKQVERGVAMFGMHALVKSLLLEKYGEMPAARRAAGHFYENMASKADKQERTGLLQKAFDQFERAPVEDRLAFEQRMRGLYVTLNVTAFRDKWNPSNQIRDLEFRLKFEPGDLPAMNELGMAYRADGNFEKAIEVLQKGAAAGNIHTMNELGITLRALGRREDAVQILQKAVDLGNIHAMNELGITLRELGRHEEAIFFFQMAIDAGQVPAMNELGITLRETGHLMEAITILQKAVDLGDVVAMNELGITLREAEMREDAIQILQRAADAGNIQSYNELGITLREVGRFEEAILILQKASDAGNIQSNNELGITLRTVGRLVEAIQVLQVAANKGHSPSMNELGITLRKLGRLEEAAQILQKSADMGNIQSFNELGITLRELGRLDEAAQILQESAKVGNIQSYNELGITLRESGCVEEAILILRTALKRKPKDTYWLRNLLQIFLFFSPDKKSASLYWDSYFPNLKGASLKAYSQVYQQLDSILSYELEDLTQYRNYLNQLFYYKSWHLAVAYLPGLIQKFPRAEFKAKLGKALSQPIIGRSQEGIPMLREAMKELYTNPKLHWLWQETALNLLEALSYKGKNEFRRNYERLEPELRGYLPFEEKRAEWEKLINS